MLMSSGANVKHAHSSGHSALLLATRTGHKDVVTSLIKAGAPVNCTSSIFESPLFVACETGNVQIVKCLIAAGASAKQTINSGDTPLIHAARYGHTDVVKELIRAGADVDAENSNQETALMTACHGGRTETVKCLLAYGADANHKSYNMNTPLIRAVYSSSLAICQELVSFGADVNAVNGDGATALIIAAKYGRAECLEFLIESGSNLNHTNQHLQTALWFTVCRSLSSCNPCLMHLLRAGVNVDFEFHCAVGFGLPDVVKNMMVYGARPCMTDIAKVNLRPHPPLKVVSPLCMALLTQSVDIARFLISVGFLTRYDLTTLPRDHALRQYLVDRAKRESLFLLDTELSQPMPLSTLSLVAVSRAVGFNPRTRQARVEGTGLPFLLQRKLLFV